MAGSSPRALAFSTSAGIRIQQPLLIAFYGQRHVGERLIFSGSLGLGDQPRGGARFPPDRLHISFDIDYVHVMFQLLRTINHAGSGP